MVIADNLKYTLNTALYYGSAPDISEKDLVNQWPFHSSEDYDCGDVLGYLQSRINNAHANIPKNLATKYVMLCVLWEAGT
jgi:hypothetical protein